MKATPLNLKYFGLLTLSFAVIISFLMKDALFDSNQLIMSQDQLNHIGGKWFRTSFWLPHWDPSKIGGYPTLDATYGSPYHPITFLQLLMDPARSLAWMFATTLLSGFISAYILGSYLTKDWRIGGLLASLFALNPQFFTHIYPGHDGKMMVIAIAPLGAYAIIKYCRENWTWGLPIFAFTSVWAIMGHIQLGYFFLWGILFFSLFENFINDTKSSNKLKVQRQVLIGIALIAGLGLCSLQIIPPYEYTTTQSVRSDAQQQSFGHSASWSNHFEETASMILPNFVGYSVPSPKSNTMENPYWGHNHFKLNHDSPGFVLLILGIIGLFSSRFWKQSLFLVSAMSLLVIYSVGADTPLFKLFYEIIPGAKSFRAPSMVLFWIPVLLLISASQILVYFPKIETLRSNLNWKPFATLIALGFILTLLRFQWPSAKGGLAGFASILFVAFILYIVKTHFNSLKDVPKSVWLGLAVPLLSILLLGFSHGPSFEAAPYFTPLAGEKLNLIALAPGNTITSFIWLVFCSGLTYFVLKIHKDQTQILIAFFILGLGTNLMILNPFNVTLDRSSKLPPAESFSQPIKALNTDSLNSYRVFNINGQSINSNFGPYFGLRFLQGDHDNKLSSFRSFKGGRSSENLLYKLQLGASLKNIQSNPFLNLLGAKSLIVRNRNGQNQIIQNDSAFARTTVFHYSEKRKNIDIPTYLKSGKSDYQNTIILDKELHDDIKTIERPNPITQTDSLGQITRTELPLPKATSTITSSNSSDFYEMKTQSESSGYILFNENFHKDWVIMVNGVQTPPLKAFHTLLAFEIPQGSSNITVQFISESVRSTKKWVYLGLAILIGLIAYAWKSNNNSILNTSEK